MEFKYKVGYVGFFVCVVILIIEVIFNIIDSL